MLVSSKFVSCLEIVAGLKEVNRNRHKVIVHKTAEKCKETHQ